MPWAVSPSAADAPPAAAAPAPAYDIPKNVPQYISLPPSRIRAGRPNETARDANRKPAEVLALSGVKPGDTVVELASFGQYFTSMLPDIVGAKGKVFMYDLPYTEERAGAASRAFVAAHPNRAKRSFFFFFFFFFLVRALRTTTR